MFRKIIIVTVFISSSYSQGSTENQNPLEALIKKLEEHNPQIKSLKKSQRSAKEEENSEGYYPDPVLKFNYFISPIETRNGPQRSNLTLNQAIPWPSILSSKEKKAEAKAEMQDHNLASVRLELQFQLKKLVYEHVLLNTKVKNRKKMISALKDFLEIVHSRVRVGKASQAEISRIHIEIAQLNNDLYDFKAKIAHTENKIKAMLDAKRKVQLPKNYSETWITLSNKINVEIFRFDTHPKILMIQKEIKKSEASLELANTKKLPNLSLSVSWFQIDTPKNTSPPDAAKDAWSIGASISIPIWSGKYNSLERSSLAEKSSIQEKLHDLNLKLHSDLKNAYEEFIASKEVVSIYKNDILPQAEQSLASNQKSYQLGAIPFDRVIDDYLRLIKFEDRLSESLSKVATFKSKMEQITATKI